MYVGLMIRYLKTLNKKNINPRKITKRTAPNSTKKEIYGFILEYLFTILLFKLSFDTNSAF